MICKTCKTEITWRMHDCKKNIGEYIGCEKCDNWCTGCRPSWNNELNNNELCKSEEDKKSEKRSKNVQKKQQRNNSRVKKKV